MNKKIFLIAMLSGFVLFSCQNQTKKTTSESKSGIESLTNEEITNLTDEAYTYALPILMSYKTMYMYSVDESGSQFKAPFNHIKNTHRVYGPKDVTVVTANSDTPYSLLWLDLRTEPIVICVPEIEKERYFAVMLQDLSTYLLPYIGTRVTGNGGGCYMITSADWKGEIPEGVDQKIVGSSDFIFAVYRTQLVNDADMDNVIKVQDGYKVQTLSAYLGQEAPEQAKSIDFIKWNEEAATGTDFIKYLNFCLPFLDTDETENELLQKLATIGVGANSSFNFSELDAAQQKAMQAGIATAIKKIDKEVDVIALAGHTAKDYNHDWLLRAAVTKMGWGANDPKEASYPLLNKDESGAPVDASKHNYTITFEKGKLPPVEAFWSLTMYDGKTQLMIENALNRYILNSPMLPGMKLNTDGSLTLYIQKDSPGKALEGNWLPAPNGEFYMLLRLYEPHKAFFDGTWKVPALKIAK